MPYVDKVKRRKCKRESSRRRYQRRRRFALRHVGGRWVVCGETDESRLELDHIDPSQKTFSFSKMRSVSEGRFRKELENAQILCCYHHWDKTIIQRRKWEWNLEDERRKHKEAKGEYAFPFELEQEEGCF